MLEIKKKWDEQTETYMIQLLNSGQIISIYFAGNLDLYWSYYDNEPFNYSSINSTKIFEITQENKFVYSLFNQLYTSIEKGNIYPISQKKERQSIEYNRLFNNGTINWLSDESPDEEANFFTINKHTDTFVVTFMQKENMFRHYTVRISNSGSRYNPFNIIFMDMFNELQKYDDIHQKKRLKKL